MPSWCSPSCSSSRRPGWRRSSLAAPGTGPFLDLGCGSGVLGIAAAKLGWGPVRALDNELAAVRAAAENAACNRVHVDVRRHDLRADPVDAGDGGTVAANLLAPLLL